MPLAQVRTMDALYRQSMASTSFTLVMLAAARDRHPTRPRCIGIRDRRTVHAARPDAGRHRRSSSLAGAVGFTRMMESLLFGVSPLDPMTFATMPVVLVAAAVPATYLPARRAVAVDPVETMRAE
jgi:putative ABC transport system permease protein